METRLERNKRLRKEIRRKRVKRFYILILILFLILGIEIVNQNIIELNCLDNPNIFRVNVSARRLDVLGESYIIDLSLLKKIIKRPVSGLLVLHNSKFLL
ncbi:hypothetical protein [Tissierella praeacuta]|uniref:hypothetical protein n=1 Tax=Tissierella praeacuta TaxID=43131 RepID=UPI001C11BD7C|nr:hypothetical protein [Tissierella praeacuta]MBU5256796.1 hypothetical protein [Tissierella praeacuta]